MQYTPLLPTRWARSPIVAAIGMIACAAQAQVTNSEAATLKTVTVNASADASAEGLSAPYAGGQVARGGRVGILGTRDLMDTPFTVTSYTRELIQNQQAHSVADVLRNDPAVRVARGFGNFQESYFIRGFLLGSDEVAYNGLYGLLPRQYVAAELFERVEVLRGASAFLNGASPNGGAIGGSINLLPKRASREPLSEVTVGMASGSQKQLAADISRRFGPDDNTGIRLNAAHREGGTGVDREAAKLDLLSLGLDWLSRDLRVSADLGYQNNQQNRTRTNVTLASGLTNVPTPPSASSNWAQPWSYSNERDTFGTLRAEYDLNADWTAWGAYGGRRSTEANSLANLTVSNASTGAGSTYRADNYRKDEVNSAEAGLRGKIRSAGLSHELVVAADTYRLDSRNAYAWSAIGGLSTSLYNPIDRTAPNPTAYIGGVMSNPLTTTRTRLDSIALADTIGLLDDKVLVTLGLRYQTVDNRSYNYNSGAQSSAYRQSRNSPMATMVWKLRPEVSLYANYIEGLTPGATAPATALNAGQVFAPYVSKQKEIGAKYDGGRLGGSVALFSTSRPSGQLDSTTHIYSIAGEDRHQGLELSVFGELTRGLKLLGGLTWLDAKQVSTPGGTTNGKRVIGVPENQANLGLEWTVPGVRGLSLDTQLITTGSFYANAANTQRVSGWTRVDVGARYDSEIAGHLVTWRARINNLSNSSYWASAGGYIGYGYLVLGAPRTVSVNATVNF